MTDPEQQDAAAIARSWWKELTSEGDGRRGLRRAALARMRRAATPLEVMQEPEALRLIARLPRNPDRVATLAGVLAFVRETDERSVPRAVGRSSLDDDQSALLSEGRFRRLLQTPEGDLLEPMRRLVRLTKGEANVYDLSVAILNWGSPGVKKRWIFEYYGISSSDRSAQPSSGPSLLSASTEK